MLSLKPNQQKAAILLATGKSAREVAKEIDVTPETISHWRQDANFRKSVAELQWEVLNGARNKMQGLAGEAVATLRDVMQNGKTDAAKLKAVEIVLAHIGMTDPQTGHWGWGID